MLRTAGALARALLQRASAATAGSSHAGSSGGRLFHSVSLKQDGAACRQHSAAQQLRLHCSLGQLRTAMTAPAVAPAGVLLDAALQAQRLLRCHASSASVPPRATQPLGVRAVPPLGLGALRRRFWAAAAPRAVHAAPPERSLRVRSTARPLLLGSRGVMQDSAGAALEQAARVKARKMAPYVGVTAGVFGAIVGVGGGVIIVPTLVNACKNIPQRVVSGTSLIAVVSTAAAASTTYIAAGHVDAAAAAVIAAAAVLTAPAGARLASRLDCGSLRALLGYFLLAVSPLVPLKAALLRRGGGGSSGADAAAGGSSSSADGGGSAHAAESSGARAGSGGAGASTHAGGGGGGSGGSRGAARLASSGAGRAGSGGDGGAVSGAATPASGGGDGVAARIVHALRELDPATAAMMAATGCVAGFASGLLGIGGGTIVTPLLALLTAMPQASVLGTSLLCMLPPSCVALGQHAALGNVDWRLGAGLAAGTVLGSAVGSQAAIQAPDGALEVAFALGMAFLGRRTLAGARTAAASKQR